MSRAFPLANLLRLRQLQEDQAASELALANAERARAEQRRLDTQRLLSEQAMPEGADPLTWQAAVAARSSLGGLVVEAAALHESRRQLAEAAADRWSAARTVARSMELLEERHAVEQRKEAERTEQLLLDETALRRTTASPSAHDSQERDR